MMMRASEPPIKARRFSSDLLHAFDFMALSKVENAAGSAIVWGASSRFIDRSAP
jgi:hypothetical protein